MPTPQRPLVQQLVPRPGTSSTLPLQSSSMPLHSSPVGPCSPTHSTPLGPQPSVPPWQMPMPSLAGSPEKQVPPTVPPGKSSTMPLQSLSIVSHCSGCGPTEFVHCGRMAPATHDSTPVWQMPVPHKALPELSLYGQHDAPRFGTSSILPLQSSSRPLHVSTPGFTSLTQASTAPWHFWMPFLQTPALHSAGSELVQQDAPAPGTSSTRPLQSSSSVLQVSVAGAVYPVQVSCGPPAVQFIAPFLQMPTPH